MSTSLLSIIAINLGILLLASWVICIAIFIKLLKDRDELEALLLKSRQKLKKNKSKAPVNIPQTIQVTEKPSTEFPLEPVIQDDDGLQLLNTFAEMSNDLIEKEQQLEQLAQLHNQQQMLLDEWHESSDFKKTDEVLTNHGDTQKAIEKLKHENTINQRLITQLENKLREGNDKDGRIAILEETENRLNQRIQRLKGNSEQSSLLADGLRKAKGKNANLLKDNSKLKRTIKELSNASQEQLATINKISSELEKVSNLEKYQRSIIASLEKNIHSEKTGSNDSAKVTELEAELQNTKEILDRTIKEKEVVESYILDLDKTLEQSKETEEALARAQKEIETLEMYFPEFENSLNEIESSDTSSQQDAYPPIETLTVSEEEHPELFTIVNDNRLFGILQEFWMTLDTPPLQLISEKNISRPKNLQHWLKISINENEYYLKIGIDKDLIETLTRAMHNPKTNSKTNNDSEDSLGELGNIIAGTLANELSPNCLIGTPEYLKEEDITQELQTLSVAAEILVKANSHVLYIALAKTKI